MRRTAISLATFFACAAPLAAETPPTETHPMESIHASGTLIAPGQLPQQDENKNYLFNLDVRRESFFTLRAAVSNQLAILFNGTRAKDRQCPKMDIKTRDYHAEEIQKNLFRVRTHATKQESALIEEHGCVVIPMPELSRITFLQAKTPDQ